MMKREEYSKNNFKNMLVEVLKMLGIDEEYTINPVLIQDVTSFLLDCNYSCFQIDFYIKLIGQTIKEDIFESGYSDEIKRLYSFLKKRLNIKKAANYISVEIISSNDGIYCSNFISDSDRCNKYYNGNIHEIISEKIRFMSNHAKLISKKLVIFNNNYYVKYETKYKFERYNRFCYNVEETIETYFNNTMVNLIEQNYNQSLDNFNPKYSKLSFDPKGKDNFEKKVYSVNNCNLEFNLLRNGEKDDKLNIKFNVPLSYDTRYLDFYNVEMDIDENLYDERKRLIERQRLIDENYKKMHGIDKKEHDKFKINTLIYSKKMYKMVNDRLELVLKDEITKQYLDNFNEITKRDKRFDKYNFKNMLIKVLEMLSIENKYANNSVLLQELTAFLIDSDYSCFNLSKFLKSIKVRSYQINQSDFELYYNNEINKLYKFLSKCLIIKKDNNIISIEIINSYDNQSTSFYISNYHSGITFYKSNINNILSEKIHYLIDYANLLSRKIVLTNNDITEIYVTTHEFDVKPIDNYYFKSSHNVKENIKTFKNNVMVKMIETKYGIFFENCDKKICKEMLYSDKMDYIEKKQYTVNADKLEFNYSKNGEDCKNLDIMFKEPLSYDIYHLDVYNIQMDIYEKNFYEKKKSADKEYQNLVDSDYRCCFLDGSYYPSDEFIINSLVFSKQMNEEINKKIQFQDSIIKQKKL